MANYYRKTTILLWYILFSLGLRSQIQLNTSPQYAPCEGNNYVLVFSDDFNGTSLNTTNWRIGMPNDNVLPGGNTWNNPANCTVSNGTLKLNCVVQPGYYQTFPYSSNTSYYEYTGSLLFSNFSFGPGKYEIRCKIPPINRGFPSFWTWHYSESAGCWNEIDIFEFFRGSQSFPDQSATAAAKRVKMTIHKESTCWDGNTHIQEGENFDDNTPHDQAFHTYSVDWDNDKISFHVDGILRHTIYHYTYTNLNVPVTCFELANNPTLPVYENPEYTRFNKAMNLMVGIGAANNGRSNSDDSWPLTLEVDYIRAWQRADCSGTKQLCELGDWGTARSFINAANIIAGGGSCNSVIGPHGFPKEYIATNSVQFLPGFHAQAGCKLTAKIGPCTPAWRMAATETDQEVQNQPDKTAIIPKKLTVLPNPSNGDFNLTFFNSNEGNLTISVYDLHGKKIYSSIESFAVGQVNIDLGLSVSRGIYLIRIEETGETTRFVIN